MSIKITDGLIEAVARVAHETNRAWCVSHGDGEWSQVCWEDAPDWQQESARNGVRFHMDHPDASPSQSHSHWMSEKLALGWTYGPAKDPEAKTHPCLLPYDALPWEQRVKDVLFRAIVRAVLDTADA